MAATTTTVTTAGNDVAEGPVLSVVNKRLRALRKKLNRITYTEEAVAQGKPINKEQEDVLRSKPSILALIDELEKLRNPLSSAVAEEVNLALKNHQNPKQQQQSQPEPEAKPEPSSEPRNDAVVEDLLNLIYFGSLFDVKSQNEFTSTMLTRTHERGCCLTYDYVTDDATDLLRERDLDLISAMRGLLISRPADSSLSHRDALQQCLDHARLWLARVDQPIEPNADVTYAGLRERLNKIMSSEYFTITPEIKATVDVAAAAAGGSYASFQVPVHNSVNVEVEGSDSQSQKDEGAVHYQGHGSGDDQSHPEGQLQKDNVEGQNLVEDVPVQHEQTNQQVDEEYNERDVEAKEQQQYPRKGGYQNQRGGRGGGGRRGYSNGGRGGRGNGRGGGYQNGRGQFYDQQQQPGNYYPKSNYYNNRGGRGGRGGGYYNNGAGGQFNHVAGDVGVQS